MLSTTVNHGDQLNTNNAAYTSMPGHVLNLIGKTAGKFAHPDLQGIFVVVVGDHGDDTIAARQHYQDGVGTKTLRASVRET